MVLGGCRSSGWRDRFGLRFRQAMGTIVAVPSFRSNCNAHRPSLRSQSVGNLRLVMLAVSIRLDRGSRDVGVTAPVRLALLTGRIVSRASSIARTYGPVGCGGDAGAGAIFTTGSVANMTPCTANLDAHGGNGFEQDTTDTCRGRDGILCRMPRRAGPGGDRSSLQQIAYHQGRG